MKTCRKCSRTYEIGEFHKHPSNKDGRHNWCRHCVNANRGTRGTPEGRRRSKLRCLYGMELEHYELFRQKAGYKCEVCGKPEEDNRNGKLYIDHCHDTQRVRGLLCNSCNRALGYMGDDIDRMKAAIAYLEKNGE